ncbi:MAG: thiamine phosphate synthase [Crocinitomicaceae bacterium]
MIKIVVSYPTELPNEIALVNKLLGSDIDYFHFRKPEFEEIQMQNYIEQLDDIHHHKIVIHNNYQLVNKLNLGGIHLNKKGLKELRTEEESDKCFIEPLLLKNNKIYVNNRQPTIVSYAAHSFADITNVNFGVDYFTLSPIFDSISKPDYKSNFVDRNALSSFLKNSNKKVIALGGITEDKKEELKQLGFAGYAVLGGYWQKQKQQALIGQ